MVRRMFLSPRRMLPLLGTAVLSLWKLRSQLRAAAVTTSATMEAFLEVRRLEGAMVRYAKKNNIGPKELKRRDCMPHIIAHIPRKEVDRFRNDVLRLIRAMANTEFLRPAIEIMGRCIEVMKSKPHVYSEEDVDGFELGKGMIEGCLELYVQFDPEEIEIIHDGIEAVELDWYEAILEEAKG